MAKKQLGTDYVVFVDVSDDETPEWKIPFCQTTVTVNTPMEVTDASSKCGNDTLVDDGQETVEFEGQVLQKDVSNPSHMSLFDFRQLMRGKTDLKFKVGPKGSTGNTGKILYSFTGKITNVSDTYPNKEVATASASISVTGQIVETELA